MCPEGSREFAYRREIVFRVPVGPPVVLLGGYLTLWGTALAQIVMVCVFLARHGHWHYYSKNKAVLVLSLVYYLLVLLLVTSRVVLHRTRYMKIKNDLVGLALILLGHAALVHQYVFDPVGELVTAFMLTTTVALFVAELGWASAAKTFNPLNMTFHRLCYGPFIELESEPAWPSLAPFHDSHSQPGSPRAGPETPESDKNDVEAASAGEGTPTSPVGPVS